MSKPKQSEFDGRDLRRAFGNFATGVTIVTTLAADGKPCGFTANSFTSVSIDPPLLLVSIGKWAHGLPVFTASEGFAVNILAREQRDLSNRFAAAGSDKFAGVEWRAEATGSPVLAGVVAWFDCSHHEQVDAGDHVILIGRIERYAYNTDAPLGFCRGAYVSFGLIPQMLQLVSSPGQLKVGALIEAGGQLLLEHVAATGEVRLPLADSVGERSRRESLTGKLASAGVEANLPFIYSAYHDGSVRYVYYLGELLSPREANETPELRFHDFDEIPWDSITDSAIRTMLERFIREQKLGNYAIYIGDHAQGEIYPA